VALKGPGMIGSTVFLMALLVATPAVSQQKNLTKLNLIRFTPDAVMAIAQARGLFAAEGLDLQITETGSSTQQMRGLGDGTYDVALTALDNVLAWSGRDGGAEFVSLAQREDGVTLPLFVRPEIKTLAELKGRKLAVDAVDTAYAFVLRRILIDSGLDFKRGDYQLVAAGAPAQRVESMTSGETYAGIINVPVDAQAKAKGLIPYNYATDFLKGYVGSVVAVEKKWGQSHRKEVTGFLRAWRSALAWIKTADRETARSLVAAQAKVSPEIANRLLSSVPIDGVLNMSGAKIVLELRSQFAGPPPKGNDLGAYVDTSYFQAASPQ
jgi:ABC-type nitrate/sulfonate/bicarbonate transport system substrate-binding protein